MAQSAGRRANSGSPTCRIFASSASTRTASTSCSRTPTVVVTASRSTRCCVPRPAVTDRDWASGQIEIEGGLRPREVQALYPGVACPRRRSPTGVGDSREGAPLRGAGTRRARARGPPGRPAVRGGQPRARAGHPGRAGVRAAARPWRRPRRQSSGTPRATTRASGQLLLDLRRRWAAAHRPPGATSRSAGRSPPPTTRPAGSARRPRSRAPSPHPTGPGPGATPTSTTSTPTVASTTPCTTASSTSRST